MNIARKTIRILGYASLSLVAILVVAELTLQVGSLFVTLRESGEPSGTKQVVLCVGDSHTYGLMVEAEESYPQRLQALLDQEAPGHYSVINLGIPGTNTGQALDQLRSGLKRYRPEIVIVWCGVNNAWNRAEPRDSAQSWGARIAGAAARTSRLYRLVKVWFHDRELERAVAEAAPEKRRHEVKYQKTAADSPLKAEVTMADSKEEIEFVDTGFRVGSEMEERALRHYRTMIAESKAAGARTIFIAYPIEAGPYAAANHAVRRVFHEYGVPVVEGWKAHQRLPKKDREFLWAGHPNAAAYAEIARDVLPLVLAGEPSTAVAARAKGLLARLSFEAELPSSTQAKADSELVVKGDCGRTTVECRTEKGCYRWNPSSATCYLQQVLAVSPQKLRLASRLRVAEFPGGSGHLEILSVLEGTFGTGVSVEFANTDQLQLRSTGAGHRQKVCGPMKSRLARNLWYGLRMRAQKSDQATLSLELLSNDDKLLDTVTCTEQPAGGGTFSHVRVGSANPAGATGDIFFDEVVVKIDRDGDKGKPLGDGMVGL